MSNNNQFDNIIDFRQFFFKIINNWIFFFLSLFLTFVLAYIYNRYTQEIYLIETSVLVKEDNSVASASDLLYENALNTKPMSLENKGLILKSFPLVYSVLEDLGFDISYYIVGSIKVSETLIAPVRIECSDVSKIIGKNITIENIDDKQFTLIFAENEKREIHQFGEEIVIYRTKIKVYKDFRYPVDHTEIPNTIIKFLSNKSDIWEDINIISKMPKLIFIKALFN